MNEKNLTDFHKSKVMDKIMLEFMFFTTSVVCVSMFLGGLIQTVQPISKVGLIILTCIFLVSMILTEIILIKKIKKVF
jgi:hypothetical protein